MVRAAFDTLIADYPVTRKHLAASADIVHDKLFESGVVKVLRGDERALTNQEKHSLARFKVDAALPGVIEAEDYMDKVLINGKRAKKTNYAPMSHISATSNFVERLFSRAKLVMTPQRRCMDPSTLEAQVQS